MSEPPTSRTAPMRPALPGHVAARYGAELQAYLRQFAAAQLDGEAADIDDLDGYSSRSGVDAVGGTPRGSFVRPAAYTVQVERRVDYQTRSARRQWAISFRHRWFGRWREALEAIEDRECWQVIGLVCVDGWTQEQVADGLGRSVKWVARRQHDGLRAMVRWFYDAGTLDGRYDKQSGRWQ